MSATVVKQSPEDTSFPVFRGSWGNWRLVQHGPKWFQVYDHEKSPVMDPGFSSDSDFNLTAGWQYLSLGYDAIRFDGYVKFEKYCLVFFHKKNDPKKEIVWLMKSNVSNGMMGGKKIMADFTAKPEKDWSIEGERDGDEESETESDTRRSGNRRSKSRERSDSRSSRSPSRERSPRIRSTKSSTRRSGNRRSASREPSESPGSRSPSPERSQRKRSTNLSTRRSGNRRSASREPSESPGSRSPSPERSQRKRSTNLSTRRSGNRRSASRERSESPDLRLPRSGDTPGPRDLDGGEVIYGRENWGVTRAIIKRGKAYDIELVEKCPSKCLAPNKDGQSFSPGGDQELIKAESALSKLNTKIFKVVGCAAKWHGKPRTWIYVLIDIHDETLRDDLTKLRKKAGERYRGPLICSFSEFKKAVRGDKDELRKLVKLLKESLFYQGAEENEWMTVEDKIMGKKAKRRTSKKAENLTEIDGRIARLERKMLKLTVQR